MLRYALIFLVVAITGVIVRAGRLWDDEGEDLPRIQFRTRPMRASPT